jgi:hypothetical protein
MAEKYNGWTNYETWCVKLWIDNVESTQKFWEWAAKDAWAESCPHSGLTRVEDASMRLARQLRDEHEAARDSYGERQGVLYDLLSAALSEVNWMEIAKSFIEELEVANGSGGE